MGRGAAFGDLDNDGKTDIVISHVNEPVVILQNTLDNGNHWLGIELIGKPYRDAVGAVLTLEVEEQKLVRTIEEFEEWIDRWLVVGDQKLVRTIKGGGSYLSAHDRRIIFGLADKERVGRLTVKWPFYKGQNQEQTWDNLAIDRYWRLIQGEKEPQAPGGKAQ
jgi:hypothetical protein